MEVLWLKHLKYSHNQICEIVFLSKRTVIRYLKDFISGGLDKLREIKFNKPQSKLVEYSGTIKEYLTENPPGTIKEAVSVIENLSGFRRSETQVRKFLKSLGMKSIKVGTVPAKADPEEQENFKKKVWIPVSKKQRTTNVQFFFLMQLILSLEETQTKKRDKLKDMLTLNVQTFKKAV